MGREFRGSRCKLLDLEWMDNKILLQSRGNYIQTPGVSHNEKGCLKKKKNVHTCIDRFAVQQKLTLLIVKINCNQHYKSTML